MSFMVRIWDWFGKSGRMCVFAVYTIAVTLGLFANIGISCLFSEIAGIVGVWCYCKTKGLVFELKDIASVTLGMVFAMCVMLMASVL